MLYRWPVALALCFAVIAPVAAGDDSVSPPIEVAPETAAATEQKREKAATDNEQAAPVTVNAEPAMPVANDPVPLPLPADTVEGTLASPAARTGENAPASEPAPTAAAAASNGPTDNNKLDAAPAEADPLTPPPEDMRPAKAPGAPERPAGERAVAEVDPFISALRTRLAAWPESRSKADQDDLGALKDYYGESDATRLWTTADGPSPKAKDAFKAFARADQWGLDASAFELPAPPAAGALHDTLADLEIRIGLDVLKYARFARGGRIDPSSVNRNIDMRPRLYEPRSIIDALAQASAADGYLESLHPTHAGFVALKGALSKVAASRPAATAQESKPSAKRAVSSDERRIVANMERWRWLPDDLGAFYIWDNVPEQMARVVHDGKVVHQAKIVVGKPSTPTPIFSMPMRFVIFHPTWGVPDGIKSNELGPMLRRAQAAGSSGWFFSENNGASRALQRHKLRVYSGGREINPDSINWSSTDIRRFSFIQPASNSNVLGLVKFRFPNKHDVYMHDTTERHLFARKARAFSHGCMRVEDPLKLAELILAYDKGWSRSRIDQIISRGDTHDVTLEKKVNVHIAYFTATVDANGKLHSHPDIYGIDSRTASALAGRSVVLSSAKADDDVKAAPAQPRSASSSPRPKQQASAAPKSATPKRWNPFTEAVGN